MTAPARRSADHPDAAELAPALLRLADALPWPLLLLDQAGTLRHANRAAWQCMDEGQPVRLAARQRVQPAAATRREEFDAALRAAAAGQSCALWWPGPLCTIKARLHPLPQAAAGAPLLLLVLSPAADSGPDLSAYADARHLSPPEQRVLQGLAAGHTAARQAQELGLTLNAVRRHTAALRRKTGHASVAELLMTIGRLPPALWTGSEGK